MPQNIIRPARLALRWGLSASSFRVFYISQELPEQNEERSVGVTQGGTSTLLSDSGPLCLISKVREERHQLQLLGWGPEKTTWLGRAGCLAHRDAPHLFTCCLTFVT